MKKFYDFKDGINFDDFYYCYSPQAKCEGLLSAKKTALKADGTNKSASLNTPPL
jgi:hypothetical protein